MSVKICGFLVLDGSQELEILDEARFVTGARFIKDEVLECRRERQFLRVGCRKIPVIFLNREFLSEILLCSEMQRPKASRTTVLDGRQGYSILEGRGLNRISDIMPRHLIQKGLLYYCPLISLHCYLRDL